MECATREIGTDVPDACKKSFPGWLQFCEHPQNFVCQIYLCLIILPVSVMLFSLEDVHSFTINNCLALLEVMELSTQARVVLI